MVLGFPTSPIGALMQSAIETESVNVIAAVIAAISTTAETKTVIVMPGSAETTATAMREGRILSRGPVAAEDDELSNRRIGVEPVWSAPSVGLKPACGERVRCWWAQRLGVGS